VVVATRVAETKFRALAEFDLVVSSTAGCESWWHRHCSVEETERSLTMFETISEEDLGRANGGVSMKLTQYGYRNDPYMDSETRKGHGAYSNLAANRSVAMTDSGLAALGLSRMLVRKEHPWVDIHLKGGGTLTRRIDDRAPERDRRTDMYMPQGFNRKLGDHANITLHR
jgi:hypothetical protein